MRALSLHQPWATLVAVGAKRIETRSWPAPRTLGVGTERLAIHAAQSTEAMELCAAEPYVSVLNRAGYHYPLGSPLPLGAVVATAVVDACFSTDHVFAELEREGAPVGDVERALGDYSPGRWAWVLRGIRPVRPAVECRGRQRVFYLPEDVAARL